MFTNYFLFHVITYRYTPVISENNAYIRQSKRKELNDSISFCGPVSPYD